LDVADEALELRAEAACVERQITRRLRSHDIEGAIASRALSIEQTAAAEVWGEEALRYTRRLAVAQQVAESGELCVQLGDVAFGRERVAAGLEVFQEWFEG